MTQRIYKRRVAFVVAGVFLVPSGGIGHFAKAFMDMADSLDWAVDLICDGPVAKNPFAEEIVAQAGNVFLPEKIRSYGPHLAVHAFQESWNLEKTANFRDAMMAAFSKNVYDMILINTNEALMSVMALGVDQQIPVINYSHNANVVFAKTNQTKAVHGYQYENLLFQLMNTPGCIVATQTDRNLHELIELDVRDPVTLPMPLSDQSFTQPNTIPWEDREGVLFIGRWENGKKPKDFIKAIQETGLPARVMTSLKGIDKFRKELDAIGAKHDVRGGIYGQEKVDFIRGSRVFYMPSMAESYGYAMLECIGQIPTIVPKEYPWWTNFTDGGVFQEVARKDVTLTIKQAYDKKDGMSAAVNADYVKKVCQDIYSTWNDFLEERLKSRKGVTSSASEISKKDNLFYHDHIKQLGRQPGIEDVISVLNQLTTHRASYTKEHTWLTRTGTPVPQVTASAGLDDFF